MNRFTMFHGSRDVSRETLHKGEFVTHGTFACYLAGCLEDCCYDAARRVHQARSFQPHGEIWRHPKTTQRVWRMEDRTITHGTRSGYVAGCRKECCRGPERDYQRLHRQEKFGRIPRVFAR